MTKKGADATPSTSVEPRYTPAPGTISTISTANNSSNSNRLSPLHSDRSVDEKGHHRRTSSLWVPPSRPLFHSPSQVFWEKSESAHRLLKSHPFIRWLFRTGPILPTPRIVTPNNHPEAPPRYRKLEWQNIVVGDFVHLSHDEIIPADILLLRSSDSNGICYVETSNLDGETNLKQRNAIRAMGKYHNSNVPQDFKPDCFKYKVVCENPTTDVYKFEGHLEAVEGGPPLPREFAILAKENVLLRGCMVKNTDFVEGIVLYAGPDTKAMLNNSGPRYKRSTLEKLANIDIIWCVVILLALCVTGAVLTNVWLHGFYDPYDVPYFTWENHATNGESDGKYRLNITKEAIWNFFSYIIVLQVLIPISLYVSIEFIKVGQIWFMSQDKNMYYEKVDKRLQCRALNIPEELGQIQYVMSDKTGTLTENQMVFRCCSLTGKNFGGRCVTDESSNSLSASNSTTNSLSTTNSNSAKPRPSRDRALETLLNNAVRKGEVDNPIFAFFITMAICNTVVVNAKPHEDLMDDEGIVAEQRDDGEGNTTEDNSNGGRQRTANASLNVKFLEEVEEEPSSERAIERKSSRESIELIEFGEDEKSSADENDSEKATKGTKEEPEEIKEPKEETEKTAKESKSILHRNSLLSLGPFTRLKGLGLNDLVPFRRSTDKRQSQSSSIEAPPLQSFYDSESPDELALVEAAREYGVRLLRRRFDEVVIYLRATGTSMKFKVLHTLPFDADRKRMSVVVRDSENRAWRAQQEEAEFDSHHRENLLVECTLKAEQELELLGVTAIEDRLQDGVPETIHSLRAAGIKVWLLTGDKVETAVNIAYSSRLFSSSMDLLNLGANGIRGISDLLDEHLKRLARATEITEEAQFGLVLNAAIIDYCLDPHNEERFVRLLKGCQSVLCCRATPIQKATLVKLAKDKLNGKVLAIGDGANDVSMIQGADVGVGLSGQEGMQAVMASDFALARFRFLTHLLLVQGHWCYYRLAETILYFFYKNAMFVFVIFWYQIFNGFSAQVPIDPLYLMVYNLLFTSVPSLLYGCLDQDASADVLLEYPALYEQGRLGKKYRWYSFWLNMVDALWQSAVVYWIAHFTYWDSACDLWTFGMVMITQLLLVNTCHLALLVKYWTWPMFWSMALSVGGFFLAALLYNGFVSPSWTWTGAKDPPVMIAQQSLTDLRFWLVIIISIVLSLIPRCMWIAITNTIAPSRTLKHRRFTGMTRSESRKLGESSIPGTGLLSCLNILLCCGTGKEPSIQP
ncbi:hypothetical protein WR25_07383 [Diploscapter pachys]|uniref:Phospholipid-transporting ATPase n=1 Tax=Diploscapter pachys TaxID=2018661 RepID=A0A2A2J7W2_9BILA|nr:hypothetical protein WR25_07383 [Diploscapter pachys]